MQGNKSTFRSTRFRFFDRSRPSWLDMFLLLPWIIGVVFLLCIANRDRAVAARQQTTYGIITAHEPSNHDRYGYAFSASGKRYTGWDSPATDFEIGKNVLVYYDAANPSKNALSDFASEANRNFSAAGVFTSEL